MELVRILILIILPFLLLTTKLGLGFYIALLVLTDVIQVLANVNALQGGPVLYVTRPVLLHTTEKVVQRYATVKMEDCVIIKQEFASVQQDILALSMYITGYTGP